MAIVLWIMVAGGSLLWNIHTVHRHFHQLALDKARTHLEKDMVFMHWGAQCSCDHLLHSSLIPSESIRTLDPARRVHILSSSLLKAGGDHATESRASAGSDTRDANWSRITSLQPLLPENTPDDWERSALQTIVNGAGEVHEVAEIDGAAHLRCMKPLALDAECMSCHDREGMQAGDVRGGLSTSVALGEYRELRQAQVLRLTFSHALFFMLGLAAIVYIYRRARRQVLLQWRTAEILRESEERFRTVANYAHDWEYWVGPEGEWNYISPSCERITGYSPEEFRATPGLLSRITLPRDRERLQRHLAEERDCDRPLSLDLRIVTRDGEERWLNHRCRPVHGDDGSFMGRRASIRDITARKMVEDELRQRLAYSGAVNRISETIIVEEDVQTILDRMAETVGQAVDADRCLIYKLDFDRLSAKGLCEWRHERLPAEFPPMRDFDLKMFPKGTEFLSSGWERLESHADEVHEVLTADGADQVFHKLMGIHSLLWIPFSRRGKDLYMLVFNQVLSRRTWSERDLLLVNEVSHQVNLALMKIRMLEERRKTQVALQSSEEKYRALYDHNPTMYFTVEVESTIHSVNSFGSGLLGYRSEELEGLSLLDLCHPNDRRRAEDLIRQCHLHPGTVLSCEIRLLRKDGESIWVSKSARGIPDLYDVPVILLACEDISERKRVEEDRRNLQAQLVQSQKMEAVGTLAGGIAHDFNNLLTVINGYAEIALHETDPEHPLRAPLTMIAGSGQRAADLTRQLLAFSRRQLIKPRLLNPNQLIADLRKILHRLIGEDISILTEPAENMPLIKADQGQFEQILINLVVNGRDAINAQPYGERFIRIQTGSTYIDAEFARRHPDSRQGLHAMIRVSDSGLGMESGLLDKIFEPFFTTKELGKGTGLGLATVYGIVRQNDGCITVQSDPGRGSTFTVLWPVAEEDLPALQHESGGEIPEGGSDTLLVVEDDDGVRGFTVEALRSLGYAVHEAANGLEAVQLLEEGTLRPDLVLTDIVMPVMNGKELVDRLAQMKPDCRILYATGHTDNQIVRNCLMQEGVDYIQKPYTLQELAGRIRESLD